jgi:(E)-4-hydroxy-3-methylbut-2-enyl-diphosphate synthase
MKIKRRKSKVIRIGNIYIGGKRPIAIQSMVKAKTADVESTLSEIKVLKDAGCEIVRLAVRDERDAGALKKIKNRAGLPIVADIHFNWRFAIQAIDSGVDKIRLNPGNIYKIEEIRRITQAAKQAHIPIRVGVNSGSLLGHKVIRSQGHKAQAEKMVRSALDYIKILEGLKFYDIVVSLKGSNIFDTIQAYRKIAKLCDYPMHLGVTATGPSYSGAIKSSIAIGALLMEGIGDTIRVSLTDRPEQEVKAAQAILGALELRNFGPEIISCPTCGRCEVNLVKIVNELDKRLSTKDYGLSTKPFKLAVMGCVVNGPGEAAQADIGVAFGRKKAVIFGKGKILGTTSEKAIIRDLMRKAR